MATGESSHKATPSVSHRSSQKGSTGDTALTLLHLRQGGSRKQPLITRAAFLSRHLVTARHRGIPTQETIRAVYALFSSRKDINGDAFKLSRAEKSIVLRDSWGDYAKITSRDFTKYLEHWTVLLDLTSHNNQPALAVVKSLPPMLVQLFHQPRYILPSMLEAFTWVD
jgi:hypothetical protein